MKVLFRRETPGRHVLELHSFAESTRKFRMKHSKSTSMKEQSGGKWIKLQHAYSKASHRPLTIIPHCRTDPAHFHFFLLFKAKMFLVLL